MGYIGLLACMRICHAVPKLHPTILDKSPWDSTAIFIFFGHFSAPSWNSASFSCGSPSPPPYTKLKLGKNSGYMRPTLFVGWGEGLYLCELENASETQSVPRLLSMIVAYHVDVLRALCCVPSPLLDKSKESLCGRLKLSPFLKILLLVKENVRDLKCLHSLFE